MSYRRHRRTSPLWAAVGVIFLLLGLVYFATDGQASTLRPRISRHECISAAEKVNVSLALARSEHADARRLVRLAITAGDTALARHARLAELGLEPLISDLRHRLGVASEAIDDGQYRKCSVLRAWM